MATQATINRALRFLPILAAIAAGIFPEAAHAQDRIDNPPLVGRIVDGETGAPLLGAWVGPMAADWGTYSRDDGTFTLPRVYSGA